MANPELKHPKNVEGRFYCTDPDDDNGEGCIACNVCYNGAPDFFAEDEDEDQYQDQNQIKMIWTSSVFQCIFSLYDFLVQIIFHIS